MKWRDWLEEWKMGKLSINVGFAEMEFAPQDPDRDAAWEMYVELITRVTTQPLADDSGDLQTALDSVHSLFATTRELLRSHGRSASEFSKIAVLVLNQLIRPFTAYWHPIALSSGGLLSRGYEFRRASIDLQQDLLQYTKMLGDMAGLEHKNDLLALQLAKPTPKPQR